VENEFDGGVRGWTLEASSGSMGETEFLAGFWCGMEGRREDARG